MIDYRNKRFQDFAEYAPGEQPQEEGWVKLNTNENPYPPSSRLYEKLRELEGQSDLFRKYPPALGDPLRKSIASAWGLSAEDVVIGNGSDEILTLICRIFIGDNPVIAIPEITYSLYEVLIAASGGETLKIPSKSPDTLAVDLEALEASHAGTVFLPNPNAPTGEFIELERLAGVIKNSEKLWVIDEAYNDFVSVRPRSFMEILKDFPNVIVVRTFSKSYSLAGLRVGYGASVNRFVTTGFRAVKDSYNEDALAIVLAQAVFEDSGYLEVTSSKIIEERQKLSESLRAMGFYVLESQANFVLASPPEKDAAALLEKLKEKKILVRYFSHPLLKERLRITIGTRQENSRLIEELSQLY